MAAAFDPAARLELEGKIKLAFSPHSPINQVSFFSGRIDQIRAVADTVTTPGLHAVLYGERGVGKTSLTNVISQILSVVKGMSRVQCSQQDSFEAVIRRSLAGVVWSEEKGPVGFTGASAKQVKNLGQLLPSRANGNLLSPDTVAGLLSVLPPYVVLVVDEFDRLPRSETADFADLMKALSDRGATMTLVLVGVAEDINHLIENHASVERCMRQIRLLRMSDGELGEIIDRALTATGFSVESPDLKGNIVILSQGFPHYVHALGQNAARNALDGGRLVINLDDVLRGMVQIVEYGDQSHRELYHLAITGTKKRSLWREVVAACAHAETDERGYFSSRAVQESLSMILGRPVIQQTVAFHLGKLTDASHGPLLERTGPERRYRYRFINPMMRPFVYIKATTDGMIPPIIQIGPPPDSGGGSTTTREVNP
ncbi:MAG TPA: AAA family ATPase [Candidatus Micrarchaeaceae archaeon]|nr:AAA family ATPase [Candidatus Micrarchaeaceae archaeon]